MKKGEEKLERVAEKEREGERKGERENKRLLGGKKISHTVGLNEERSYGEVSWKS